MNTWISTIKDAHEREPRLPSWSKKTLFTKAKPSAEWHEQIAFTAGGLRPSDPLFKWHLVRKHTDIYIKKKGKLSKPDIDAKLASMIDQHDTRDVAVAACAHAMSPKALRAVLDAKSNVAPINFAGLEMYLECLIAANHSSPHVVTRLEAQWARLLLPWALHGAGAASNFLEGVCYVLRTTDTPNMEGVPEFFFLTCRAFRTFATQLDGMRIRCQWVAAYNATAWMRQLADTAPSRRPSGSLRPEQLMDAQFPLWSAWARWKPNFERIVQLGSLDASRRGVLFDMMALEGPDFISASNQSLRDGIIGQYTPGKPFVRFRSLVVKVTKGTREELAELFKEAGMALERALKGGDGPFRLFANLTLRMPICQETFQLLDAVEMLKEKSNVGIYGALGDVYAARGTIGGRHIAALKHLVRAIDDVHGERLRKVILRPWFMEGIEQCIKECCAAIRGHIESGLVWEHLFSELYAFYALLKGSPNCLPLLSGTIQRLLSSLPPSDTLQTLLGVLKQCEAHEADDSGAEKDALKCSITAWIAQFLQQETLGHAAERTVETILQVWNDTASQNNSNPERRSLALLASKRAGSDFVLRIECLNQIVFLPEDFVLELLKILESVRHDPEHSCVEFTKLLSKADAQVTLCWKRILSILIVSLEPKALTKFALEKFKANDYLQFMLDLTSLFSEDVTTQKDGGPLILHFQSHVQPWIQKLSNFLPTITRLEEALDDQSESVAVILQGGDGRWHSIERILETLTIASKRPVEVLMQKAVDKLTLYGTQATRIAEFVERLLAVTPEGLSAIERVWEAKYGNDNGSRKGKSPVSKRSGSNNRKITLAELNIVPDAAIEVIIAGWLQNDSMLAMDKRALSALATLIGLESYEDQLPKEKILAAADYFEREEATIIEEARRLESLAKALKLRDPHGTRILLQELCIEDTDPLTEELESLPIAIAGAVEKIGYNEVEISFPILKWTELERSGMGVGEAKTLLVRLFIDPLGDMPTSFCLHLDTDVFELDMQHTPWTCLDNSKAPEDVFCSGRASRFTWQMSRMIYTHLESSGSSIADLHEFVKRRLSDMAQACPVCDVEQRPQGAQLRRATPCSTKPCTRIWNNVPLEIRIPELLTDTFAIDMLLTGAYVAAKTGRTELLPGCPVSSTVAIQTTLDAVSPLRTLQATSDISAYLRMCHKDAEKLLVWAATHFGGFFVTAKGICKIPGMPVGTHQFILANAAPAMEASFAATLPRTEPKTMILFHGTSIDRLPAILNQGLRIHSGTSLQRTGAAHGRGIYMAEEPSYSFSYSAAAVSWKNSGLNGMKMLLGCEVAGLGRRVSPGVHVIQEEKSVMVRYVFLLPGNATAPIANHVVPAMTSALNALRSGAI